MNCSNITRVCRNINVCALTYIVGLLQGQRTDPSTLPKKCDLNLPEDLPRINLTPRSPPESLPDS